MPVYQYRERGGRLVERVLPICRRDDFPGRVTVPEKLMVCPRGEPRQADSVMNGFRQVEQQIGTTGIRREMEWTPNQIKRIWAQPED